MLSYEFVPFGSVLQEKIENDCYTAILYIQLTEIPVVCTWFPTYENIKSQLWVVAIHFEWDHFT